MNMPFKFYPRNYLNFKSRNACNPDLSALNDKWGQKIETESITAESVKLINYFNEAKNVFMTNESFILRINFSKLLNCDKNSYLRIGLYRDDGVYCQGLVQHFNRNKSFKISFPKFPLLPGGYKISLGIWDDRLQKFLMCHHAIYSFQMIFNRQDHGTVFMEHSWNWAIPKGGKS